MADVPISDALIDSAQFQIQSADPATPEAGLVRLFRGIEGWAEKLENGGVNLIGGALRVTVTTLTSADLLEFNTVPKVVVTSPGPGKVALPVWWAVVPFVGTVPYTSTGGRLTLHHSSTTTDQYADYAQLGSIWEGSFGEDVSLSAMTIGVIDTTINLIDKPLVIVAENPLTGGNGTAKVVVLYFVL